MQDSCGKLCRRGSERNAKGKGWELERRQEERTFSSKWWRERTSTNSGPATLAARRRLKAADDDSIGIPNISSVEAWSPHIHVLQHVRVGAQTGTQGDETSPKPLAAVSHHHTAPSHRRKCSHDFDSPSNRRSSAIVVCLLLDGFARALDAIRRQSLTSCGASVRRCATGSSPSQTIRPTSAS